MQTAPEQSPAQAATPARAGADACDNQDATAVGQTPDASAAPSASPGAKTPSVAAAPSSSAATAKKAGPGRPKKAKDGTTPKKTDQSPAASGLRGISFFMVPISKKAKTEDSPPKKEVGGAEKMDTEGESTAKSPERAPAAGPASSAEKEEAKPSSQAPQTEVVDLISPKTSPSKARARDGQGEDTAETVSEPVTKRQCIQPAEAGDEATTPSKSEKDIAVEVGLAGQTDAADKESSSGAAASKSAGSEAKAVKKPSPAAPSSAEKEERTALLREELTGLGLIKLSGETIPSLRPSASDIMNDFDLDAIRKEEAKTMSMKTRQVMARFLEGSARSSKEVATLLLGGAANKPSEDEEADCLLKIEECIHVVARLVERRPKISAGAVQADGSVNKWEVKDVADIPERCRALVETHRKMEVSLCERIKLIESLLTELSSSKCKATVKMDKSLVVIKDKYLKLEEKEKKERDKLEGKLDAERKKQQQREEKEREKERKKAEEKEREKERKKAEERGRADEKAHEAEARQAAADSNEVDADAAEEEEYAPSEAEKPKKEKKKAVKEGKTPGRPKKAEPIKGAAGASIMSFFGKGAAAPKPAAPHHDSAGGADKGGAGAEAKAAVGGSKERRNFHRWEKPKNAMVAPFPYGPAESKGASRSAAAPDLTSWLAVLRSEPVRAIRARPLREDGMPHPKMKLVQLNMKIPLVRTQLVDVDVEAEKKLYWDVEWDEAQEKLNEIMANVEQQPDGLFKYQGRMLQMLMEGGGWFDCRRPAYYGTNSKTSKLITPLHPLAQDPELDYGYETDADWESEMGDGEDIGSDLDLDEEEEEEDEDGGFVVPDGYGSDEGEGESAAKSKKRKLEQVVHYRSLPAELEELLAVQVVDSLPLCLSSDPNVHLEENTDFVGEDVCNIKVGSLEAAISAMHKHPTAVAFTYILPDGEHKLGGTVFLKSKKPSSEHKTELLGVVSGCLIKVPEHKNKALWKEMLAAPTDASMQPAAKVENSSKQVAAAKLKISDAHLLAVVKLVHGSARSKNDLVLELMEVQPDIPKSRGEKIIATVAQKKVEKGASRWVLLEETLKRSAFIAEIAKEAWKANTSKPPAKKLAAAPSGGAASGAAEPAAPPISV